MKCIVTISILTISTFFYGCNIKSMFSKSDSKTGAHANLIDKDVVRKVDLRDIVSQTGEIQPVVKVELKSEASGKIDSVYIKEGERVKKGELILKIDPTRLLTQKKKLSLAVRKAKLSAALAKRDFDNANTLFSNGQLPRKQLEDLQNNYELKEITLKERELELNDILYQLSKTRIMAPMDGVLIALLVEEGEIAVSATSGFSGGTAIGTIADISKLEVITQIGEIDYVKIKKGQAVTINMESNTNLNTSGKVSFVSLAAQKEDNSTISSFEVRIAIDSLIPGLVPGVNVNVDFVVLDKKQVLGIPYAMVQKTERKGTPVSMVFLPEGTTPKIPFRGPPKNNGKNPGSRRYQPGKMGKRLAKNQAERSEAVKNLNLVRAKIITGETDYKYIEVLDGLAEGDTVVKIIGGQGPH